MIKSENEEYGPVGLFIDMENIGGKINVKKLIENISDRFGNPIIKKAYGDWTVFDRFRTDMRSSSVDMIELPQNASKKNGADIKLAVDAIEVALMNSHVHTFIIVSSDSDFSSLLSKLREHNKYTVIICQRDKTNEEIMKGHSNEMYYYSNFISASGSDKDQKLDIAEAFSLLRRAIAKINKDEIREINLSYVKDTMKSLDPSFNEVNYNLDAVSKFSDFMDIAEREKIAVARKVADSNKWTVALYEKSEKLENAPDRFLAIRDLLLFAIDLYCKVNNTTGNIRFDRIVPLMNKLEEDYPRPRWPLILQRAESEGYIEYNLYDNGNFELTPTELFHQFIKQNQNLKPQNYDNVFNLEIEKLQQS